MTKNRRGSSRSGNSYNDPTYDLIEAELEKQYGLPPGGMRAIRTKGERSNADQISSAGARTVYQIIPSTRDAFLKKYGVDAYSSKEAAAQVAALHLRDDMQRTGSWEGAVRGYIGGTDRSNHGSETSAYVARVTGTSSPAFRSAAGRGDYQAMLAELGSGIEGKSMSEILNTDPADLADARRPVGPVHKDGPSKAEKRAAGISALTGGVGVLTGPRAGSTADLSQERKREADAVEEQKQLDGYGVMDRIGSAVWRSTFAGSLIRALEGAHPEAEPGFHDYYTSNWQDIEGFAETSRERGMLREATSREDLLARQQRIQIDRIRDKMMSTASMPLAYDLGAAALDPAGWVAGLGAGKLVQGFGVTSRLIGTAAEGAIGNLAMTAAMDAAGDYTTGEDYAMSGLVGLGIGAALHRVAGRSPSPSSAELEAFAGDLIEQGKVRVAERQAQAVSNLGEGADSAAVAKEVSRLERAEAQDVWEIALSPVPSEERLLSSNPEELLTARKARLGEVTARYGLDGIADDAERGLVAEHTARAEAIDAANPIDPEALKTMLAKVGQESTGLRLLSSESPVARAVGRVLLESTTGAGGRRRTAAMAQIARERAYMRGIVEYDQLSAMFRKGEGTSLVRDLWDGQSRKRFDRRVFAEIEARGAAPEGWTGDANPAVIRAANLIEQGMDRMRVEQQHVDVVGSARLGAHSRGYIPHRLDPAKVTALSIPQQRQVRRILAQQLAELNDYTVVKDGEQLTKSYDAAFSKKLAAKYLEIGMDRAKGAYEVPFNLHSPEAADIVRDALEAMNLPKDEVEKLMGKYSRGGASHTKQRLRFDLSADIGDGMKLQDLFVNDVVGLYRSYARRVSGEVALAQYGIMGKKGLNVLRKSIASTGGTPDDLKAFDQIAAEFLNTPFGDHNHRFMDNVRIATSVARLGTMGITQLGEYGNAMAAVGVSRTLSAIASFGRLRREVGMLAKGKEAKNPILQSIDQLGGHIGLDGYQLTRMFDIKDNDVQLYSEERLGVLSRALRGAGHMQAIASGHRMITAVQTRGMAEQVIRKAVGYIRDGREDRALADMGFTPALREAIKANLDRIATFDAKGNLLELDLLKGDISGHDLMTIRDAVERGSGQIIQRTYIGETGAWSHDGFLKMLAQFRTFSITSVEKQWGRNVHNHGALKSFMYLMGAMSFAAPIHMARVHSRSLGMSRSEREEYVDRNLTPLSLARATLNYASASGLAGDIIDVGMGFASSAGVLDDDLAPFVGARGQTRGSLVGGVIAPGVGLVDDIWQGVHGDGKKLARALPGANLPYVSPLITGLTSD